MQTGIRSIEHACYDIAKNGTSITEAAFRNGFNDLSYFAKTFKRCKGISPREFKALVKQNTARSDAPLGKNMPKT